MYRIKPDDPFFEELDPVQKLWMYQMWLGDQIDEAELAKNHAYLLASFDHPEAVKQIMGDNSHTSTDEEFEESTNMVRNMNLKALAALNTPPPGRRRKHRLVNKG